ncbi:MAG TPA: Ig-like domain-containing protein [Gemmatimonadales bacterium]|nr:Ig-like domain-containing protein [Gemmatimonadales bacterium]
MDRLSRCLGSFGAALGLLLTLTHCGGGGLTLPDDAGAAGIIKITGDNQQGVPGSALAESLAVKVTDGQGGPLAGLKVAFSLDGEASGAQVSPAQARTGSDGMARARWVLGAGSGPQAVVASVVGSGTLQVRFEASIAAGDPVRMESVSGDGQRGSAGAALGNPLVVRVSDQFGNPVANVSVKWDGGDGSVHPATSQTGADGQASTTWTLGSSTGSYTATASSGSLDGSPVRFGATAVAGSADRLVQVSGNNQSGNPGAELAEPLVVRLVDRDGNGVSGRAVTWVVGAGGGSVASNTSNTDADGQAEARWTLGSSSGTNTLNAVVSGVGVVGFTATARSEGGGGGGGGSQAARLAFLSQPSDTREDNRISPPVVVMVLDAQGNRFTASEIEVKLELTGDHDGRLGGNRTERTSSGVATFSDLSVGRRGTYRLHATADGLQAADSDRFDVNSKRGGGGGGDD